METVPIRNSQMPMTLTPWINVAIGIAVIIAPFAGVNASHAIETSNVITGIIVGIIALIAFFASRSMTGTNIAIINILAGIWLVISTSFAHDPALIWENVAFGILAILTAALSMGEHQQLTRLSRR